MIITKDAVRRWLNLQIKALENKDLLDETGAVVVRNLMGAYLHKELQVNHLENIANALGVEIQCEYRGDLEEYKYMWYFMYKDYKIFTIEEEAYEK